MMIVSATHPLLRVPRVQFEGLPDRAKPFVDPALWQELQPFDPQNDLHVDRLAARLLAAFQQDDDGKAFEALVGVAGPKLEAIADTIAADIGLILPPRDLLSSYLGRLFIALERPTEPTRHFLLEATRRMTEEAEAWVRDFALADVTAADRADGEHGAEPETVSEGYARIVQICFHRMDRQWRRLLRAKDVEQLSDAAIASRYNLTEEQAAAQIHEARHRLDDAVQAAQGGSA